MDQNLLSLILADTYTKTDALRRLRLLKAYLIKAFFGTKDLSAGWETPDDVKWLSLINPADLNGITADNVYQQLEEADKRVKSLSSLTVYVPVPLPYPYVVSLGQHLRQSYGTNFVVDIKLDPQLIAGCALVWNGVYRDYSLRQKIRDNKERILEEFKELLKK